MRLFGMEICFLAKTKYVYRPTFAPTKHKETKKLCVCFLGVNVKIHTIF